MEGLTGTSFFGKGIKVALTAGALTVSLGVTAGELQPPRPDEASVPVQGLNEAAPAVRYDVVDVTDRARVSVADIRVDRAATLSAVSERLAEALEFHLEQSVASLRSVNPLAVAQ